MYPYFCKYAYFNRIVGTLWLHIKQDQFTHLKRHRSTSNKCLKSKYAIICAFAKKTAIFQFYTCLQTSSSSRDKGVVTTSRGTTGGHFEHIFSGFAMMIRIWGNFLQMFCLLIQTLTSSFLHFLAKNFYCIVVLL